MQEPLSSRTDADHVDAMLGALQWARPLQKLSGISEDDRDAFGLTTPRLEVRFTAADQAVPVALVARTRPGTYLQLDDPTVAYVVGVDLFGLDHEGDYFRSRASSPPIREHTLRGQSEESWRMG